MIRVIQEAFSRRRVYSHQPSKSRSSKSRTRYSRKKSTRAKNIFKRNFRGFGTTERMFIGEDDSFSSDASVTSSSLLSSHAPTSLGPSIPEIKTTKKTMMKESTRKIYDASQAERDASLRRGLEALTNMEEFARVALNQRQTGHDLVESLQGVPLQLELPK